MHVASCYEGTECTSFPLWREKRVSGRFSERKKRIAGFVTETRAGLAGRREKILLDIAHQGAMCTHRVSHEEESQLADARVS
jgi:hypothetical protein